LRIGRITFFAMTQSRIDAIAFGGGLDELHEHAPELKGYVDHQAEFVAAEIKDDPVVAHGLNGTAELPL
jgi:hypothetical protein